MPSDRFGNTTHYRLVTTGNKLNQLRQYLRKRNRFFRVIFSPHGHDLQTIASAAALLVTVIIWFWGHILFSSQHTAQLDNVLDKFHDNVMCLESYSSSDIQPALKDLRNAQAELTTARGKIQEVNGYLWTHIFPPSDLFEKKIDAFDSALKRSSANESTTAANKSEFSSVICQGWPATLDAEHSQNIKTQISGLTSSARLLASTLAYNGSTLSVWAVAGVFGTVFLTFGGWLYRTGDARMTTIDVIASEIFSLCRAITNNRSIRSLSLLLESKTPPYSLRYLELQEVYNDFMHAVGQNLGFLHQSCIARITGFHTSLKILRDRTRMLRSWAIDASGKEPSLASKELEFVGTTLKQIMYDFLLCLENARIALHLLLEGDEMHDDSIFVCLMSEIRAFIVLKKMQDNAPYIRDRLEARLSPPHLGTLEELESYLHPVYAAAVCKMCDKYTKFYGDDVGIEIIHKLRADVEESLRRAASATATGPAEKAPAMNTGPQAEPSLQA
jgi:hypothetical protein